MYDQSFGKKSLEQMFKKGDFSGLKTTGEQNQFREASLLEAVDSAIAGFGNVNDLFSCFELNGKIVFTFPRLGDELVARKLCKNFKASKRLVADGRSQIVSNLRLLLEEGVPYRVYRLDIKSFYESFQDCCIRSEVADLVGLSPQSKKLIEELMTACHSITGGHGLPRGLPISAVLSDLLMHSFDKAIQAHGDVFFYSRYVDDVIVMTSTRERPRSFVKFVEEMLPDGLFLNREKLQIVSAENKVHPVKASEPIPTLFKFDYLGYSFEVREPKKINSKRSDADYHRHLIVDLASKKITRFQTRISRSFYDFSKTRDFRLLEDRVKFLTKNFSVYNVRAGGKKTAGIYFSYPLISEDSVGLKFLDAFLRNSILSKRGRLFSSSLIQLNPGQKRRLLSHSFSSGHAEKCFVHFSGIRLRQIQTCWKN